MNRRGFLRLFGVSAAAVVADPDLLLWTPGKRKFFIPPPVQVFADLPPFGETFWWLNIQNGHIKMDSLRAFYGTNAKVDGGTFIQEPIYDLK